MIDQLELLRTCRNCGAERPSGRTVFCSVSCSRLWHRRASRRIPDRLKPCRVCGRTVIDPATRGRRIGARGRPRFYCSERCKRIGRHARDLKIEPSHPALALRGRSGACEICGQQAKLSLDHDHATDRLRGWLCTGCNLGLGIFGDEPDRLRKAAAYLEA